MSEIQQNRYDQLLRRVADLKGPGSKVSWALGDLLPVIDVENVPPELQLLMGTRLCMALTTTVAGGVGFFDIHLLRNNVGSGVVATLHEIIVHHPGSVTNMGPTQNSGTLQGVRAFRDGRVFGQGTALVTMADNNSLVTGSTFAKMHQQPFDESRWTPPGGAMVITPGTAFSVSPDSANLGMDVTWVWSERVAQPSELNL